MWVLKAEEMKWILFGFGITTTKTNQRNCLNNFLFVMSGFNSSNHSTKKTLRYKPIFYLRLHVTTLIDNYLPWEKIFHGSVFKKQRLWIDTFGLVGVFLIAVCNFISGANQLSLINLYICLDKHSFKIKSCKTTWLQNTHHKKT